MVPYYGGGGSNVSNSVWAINTGAMTGTTGAWVNQYFNTTQTATATQLYYGQTDYQNSYALSESDLIRQLQLMGHLVLKKQQHTAIRPLKWDDNPKVVDLRIHHGYVLPEAEGDYLMPDGSTLKVDTYGNYQVLDQDAKVTYKANRIRNFNPYLSAADLLETFIKEVGRLDGVNQDEILRLPIEAFVNWLILQAATKDGDSLDGLPTVEKALPPPVPRNPRCLACGRFMSRMWAAARVSFCSESHFSKYQKRLSYG